MKNYFTIGIYSIFGILHLWAQCDPPAALTCEEVNVLCGLEALDGLSCTSLSMSNPTGPSPLCSGNGVPDNTQWWAFKGNGKRFTITISVDLASCSLNKGIQAGIVDRSCGNIIKDCNADCNTSSITLSVYTDNCATYYLYIDGCEGDVCDYDIQVFNGEPAMIPRPLPIIQIRGGHLCHDGYIWLCLVDFSGECNNLSIEWTVDGIDVPQVRNRGCVEIPFPDEWSPTIEICSRIYIDASTQICDEATICKTIVLQGNILTQYDGEMNICWEEHQGAGYLWRDTLIYQSCIDPPCRVIRKNSNECFTEYSASINMLKMNEIRQVFKVICDASELPIIADDGQLFDRTVCNELITWPNPDNYNCDTSYILNMEVFEPDVTFIQSCLGCEDSIAITVNIDYISDCGLGQFSWLGYWLNEPMETIGIGDTFVLKDTTADIFFKLLVNYSSYTTGIGQSCFVNDTSWHIKMVGEAYLIRGDSLICQTDTSEFSLPDAYAQGCAIIWTLERGLEGDIIFPNTDNKSKIEVLWTTDNLGKGQICAEYTDDCDTVRSTCKTLQGCIITQTEMQRISSWRIFPNPSHDFIYVQGNDMDEMHIRMIDLEGNEIFIQPERNMGEQYVISVKNILPGVYFIVLSKGNSVEIKKVVVW